MKLLEINIWGEIFIGVIIASIVGLIAWIAKIIIKKFRTADLKLDTKFKGDENEGKLVFRIVNTGREATKGTVYWHIFIDKEVELIYSKHNFEEYAYKIGNNHFLHFRDSIVDPIYQDSPYECMSMMVILPKEKQIEIRGFISSDQGRFPKNLRASRKEISMNKLPIIATITAQGLTR